MQTLVIVHEGVKKNRKFLPCNYNELWKLDMNDNANIYDTRSRLLC